MKSIIEVFFGEWECVVSHPVIEIGALIVCHKHSITGRVKGYVDRPGKPRYTLTQEVAEEHTRNYGKTQ